MMRPRWLAQDLLEIPLYARMALALRRASVDGRETCATVLLEQVERRPNAPFVRVGEEVLSFERFNAGVNRYAHLLAREGVGRGDAFVIAMANGAPFLMAQCAAAKLGAIAALVNHHLAGASLAHAVAAANPRLVLADEATLSALAALKLDMPLFALGHDLPPGVQALAAALDAESEAEPPLASVRGQDVFLYLYTSGTTGYPKAALIRHMRFTMAGIALSGILGINHRDVVYAPLPLYHGQSNFVGFSVALRVGAGFATAPSFSARAFLPDLKRQGATMFVYVGELCRYLLALPESAADRAHSVRIIAGAGLRPDIWQRFQQRFGIERIVEMYGATEGNLNLMNRAGRPGSVGRPQPFQHRNVALVRVNASGEPVRDAGGRLERCRDGEVGELLGRVGSGLISYDGYLERAATEAKLLRDGFRPGDAWFRSGDLLRRDRDGYYDFVDRTGDTFRWKGENVASQEVADVITASGQVTDTSVYGVEVAGADGRAGMAAVVPSGGQGLDLAALANHLDEHLPMQARPVFLRQVASLQTTGTLKHRKVELAAESFDARKITDPLWVRPAGASTYQRLDEVLYDQIVRGEVRL